MSLITLMTDFGRCDGYVGVMRGVIAKIAAAATVVDLTHDIPPQNVGAARFVAMNSYRYFPAGTVHCIVVDPGVGTRRRAIAVAVTVDGDVQFFVAPDNGVLDGVLAIATDSNCRAVSLTNRTYWRTKEPSATFHGRDIFAPVAAHLAQGVDFALIGEAISVSALVRMSFRSAIATSQGICGSIQYIDRFGNAITNIPAEQVTARSWQIRTQGQTFQSYRSYGDAPSGRLLGLIGSHDWVEIAVNGGSAAKRLGLQVGTSVTVMGC